jgi:hypothetical protein
VILLVGDSTVFTQSVDEHSPSFPHSGFVESKIGEVVEFGAENLQSDCLRHLILAF